MSYLGRVLPEHRESLISRFWIRVNKSSRSECWLWSGNVGGPGYGQLTTKIDTGKTVYAAHRIAYELGHGPIPTGLHVLHKCNARRCCNPGHLYAGTNLQNIQDRINSGLKVMYPDRRGGKHPQAKLTDEQARQIRESAETGASLASRYGVTPACVSAIRKRKTYQTA